MLPDYAAGALCYLMGPVTGVLFLTLDPYRRNREVRFHAWQSVLFGGAVLAIFIAGPVLTLVAPLSLLDIIGFTELGILFLCVLVWLALMYKAYVGDRLELPVIGAIARRKA